ncbi:hypothetical protein ACFC58_32645 [Kitasatospora purpeofusca]|uniref:hypothetical protein n=1 Tax=Kitasatospora purpeofusca TaxID=67352 RepID=UPI0035E0ABE4
MPQHSHAPTRICPDCSGHATAHIATGVRLRDGSRATIPVTCPTCHGASTVARLLALVAKAV